MSHSKNYEPNDLFKTCQQVFDFLMAPNETNKTTLDPEVDKSREFILSSEKKFVHDVLEINGNPEHPPNKKKPPKGTVH